MATEMNNKKVTLDQMKKALARSKSETEKVITAAGGGDVATDAEVDAMLDEVFGTETTDPAPSGTEGGEA